MVIHIDLFFHTNKTNVDNENFSTTLGSYLSQATLASGAWFYLISLLLFSPCLIN